MKDIFRNLLLLVLTAASLFFCGCDNDKRAILTVTGSPGRTLKIDNKTTVKLDKTLQIKLPAGKHLFEVSQPGYETLYKMSSLEAGKTHRFSPKLVPVTSAVLIESEPKGASVEFNGSTKGITPLVIRDLAPGNYKAHIFMPGFAKREITWTVKDARPLPRIKVTLAANTAKVKIVSLPAKAEVYIDDIMVGKTPFEGSVETGMHRLQLRLKGHIDHTTQLNIRKPAAISKKFILRARPGIVRVISTPAGAAVTVNNEKRGNTPLVLELDKGEHTLVVSKDGFDAEKRKIKVAPDQNEEILFNLGSSTGNARFLIAPGNVSMRLDGKDMGKTDIAGEGYREINFKNLTPGTHILDLSHPRANPQRISVKFKVFKDKLYQHPAIELWIRNCEVTYLDGRKEQGMLYYHTPDGIMFGNIPKVKFLLEKSKYKSHRMLPEK